MDASTRFPFAEVGSIKILKGILSGAGVRLFSLVAKFALLDEFGRIASIDPVFFRIGE